jgi:hypothetical protein
MHSIQFPTQKTLYVRTPSVPQGISGKDYLNLSGDWGWN